MWQKINNHWYNLSLAIRITDVKKLESKDNKTYYTIGIKYSKDNWENISFDAKSEAETEHAKLIQAIIKNN